MKSLLSATLVLVALVLAFVAFLFGSATLLPAHVATHFGASGEANGWMSRSEHLWFISALGVTLPLLFAVAAWTMGFIPAQYFNLPRRDYWLSPERQQMTRRFISSQLLWVACLEVLFFVGLQYLMIQANHETPAHLPMSTFWSLVGGFIVAMLFWLVRFGFYFARTK